MRTHRLWCLAALLALGLTACKKDEAAAPLSDCKITYEMLDGEPSDRVDYVEVSADRRVVSRVATQGGVPVEAIYYYFDAAGKLVTEALDRDLDGEIDARLDAGPLLGGILTPFSVDVVLEDKAIDGIQFNMELPSSMIGPWNPARIYYQVSCDQGDFREVDSSDHTLRLELNRAGEPVAKMSLQFGEDDRLQTWTIDGNNDEQTDHIATLSYDEGGRIREVFWNKPEKFLGETYLFARFTYDHYGMLYSYELDADADGTFDHRITYSTGCFDYTGLR